MWISRVVTIVLCAVSLSVAAAGKPVSTQNETSRISYSLGYRVGEDYKRQGVELNADAVVKGLEDALSGADPEMKPEEMHTTLIELKRKILAEREAKRRKELLEQIAADKKFLQENAKKRGVVTTASGLQYQIIKQGAGKIPGPTDQVTVNYRGKLTDGKEFDSSYRHGKAATLQLGSVIKGWTEGLQKVREGGKIKLFIPPGLAYGQHGPLAGRTLVFEVELLSVGVGEGPGKASTSGLPRS